MTNAFDTTTAPSTEPAEIIAGDFTRWKRTDLASDYPNTLYTLKYELRGEGDIAGRQYTFTASADGDDYLVQIASTTSGDYKPGQYQWFAYMVRDSDSERAQIDAGRLEIRPDRATDAADPARHARRMLERIETALEGRADNFQLDTLSIDLDGGVTLSRDPVQLLKWRGYYRGEVRRINERANAKKGRRPSNRIQVGFK